MGNLNINTVDNQITITPTDTQIRVFSGGYAQPGGANTEVQYNNGGVLAGAANINYTNGNMVISNNNFKITGGTNGYFLQTDGSGNLTWYPGTAFPTGNGTVGGANMQLQFNNAGNFGGIAGLTANVVNNNVNMPNNLAVVSNVSANYFIGNGSQLTGIDASKIQNGNSNVSVASNSNITFGVAGNANVVTVTGNGLVLDGGSGGTISGANLISANIISATGNVTANYFIGNGSQLTGIDASQISNGNSNVRVFANSDVTISIGGFANVLVMNAANSTITTVYDITANGGVTATQFIGGGANLSNINAANITGNFSSLTILGTTTLQQVKEKTTIDGTGATGTINFDLLDQALLYKNTDATNNFTINLRGNSTTTLNAVMSNGQSMTCTFLSKTGALGYYANNITIDSANITTNWLSSAPITGIPNSINSYTLNIIKTGSNTFTVLATLLGYV